MIYKIKLLSVSALIITLFGCADRNNQETLFSLVPSEHTNVSFNNEIADNDTFNIINYEYIYNGGGVAIADFDNDGLSDIFFSGNIVSNKLYRNKGDFQFDDISEVSGISAPDSWCSGIAIVDINQDGYKDIYVCTNTKKEGNQRKNLLFVNKSNDSDEIVFEEMAESYGIADSSYSTNSAFFDYDNDGDLDLFIINNHLGKKRHAITYSYKAESLVWDRVDRLYRNDWSEDKGHPFYTDVTREAGILNEGYSLGLNICDINRDGWKDIYITNDFISDDLLYINNQDGTFSNKAEEYLKHTCHSAMGNDIADVNNDGLFDIVAVDMLPESNYRKKTMMGGTNYTKYVYNERYDYTQQYIRNVLQINQGQGIKNEELVFSELAMMAGIEATDWSWAPLLADFDLDGHRDLIITNGFPKDITDKDFIEYRSNFGGYVETRKMLSRIPEVKLPNYAYRNTGSIEFENVTRKWGMNIPSFSNGAAYGDLDNDGDLDLVISNINDAPFIYRNNNLDNKYIAITLIGTDQNKEALGTIIKYKSLNHSGIYEHTLSRGYLSSMDEKIVIGLGQDSLVDIDIFWPNGEESNLENIEANQILTANIKNAESSKEALTSSEVNLPFMEADFVGDDLIDDLDYIDYNEEPLLFRKISQNGPGVSVADINGDGLDDYYATGSYTNVGQLFIQTKNGEFVKGEKIPVSSVAEEQSSLFFDVDGDGDQDLYIANGANQFEKDNKFYKDVLLINENGKFRNISESLNLPSGSTSCVRASDFDRDGDLDLFVGGRVSPKEYPLPTDSYLLINNSSGVNIKLDLANTESAPELNAIGMVCDALWTDYDNDGWQDLLIAGEWMPVTFFKNNNGKLEKVRGNNELDAQLGWWNSISSADFDNDGDMDYVIGNFGTNSSIRASKEYPVDLYAKDFDDNGSLDALPFVYFKDLNGELQKYPFHERDDLTKEMNKIKKLYTTNHRFGFMPIDSILSQDEQESAYHLSATTFESIFLENKGEGTFGYKSLPTEAQVAPVFGMITDDYNDDGKMDLVLIGNDFGTQPGLGRMDALNGLVLKGDGKGDFESLSISESGFYVPGDGKALANIIVNGKKSLIASQNKDQLLAFHNSTDQQVFEPEQSDAFVTFYNSDRDKKRKVELYFGNGYLSQSSRKISIPSNVEEIQITKYNGETRTITLN